MNTQPLTLTILTEETDCQSFQCLSKFSVVAGMKRSLTNREQVISDFEQVIEQMIEMRTPGNAPI